MQLAMGWFQIMTSGTSSNPFFPIRGGGGLHGTDITLIKEDKIITDDRELAEVNRNSGSPTLRRHD